MNCCSVSIAKYLQEKDMTLHSNTKILKTLWPASHNKHFKKMSGRKKAEKNFWRSFVNALCEMNLFQFFSTHPPKLPMRSLLPSFNLGYIKQKASQRVKILMQSSFWCYKAPVKYLLNTEQYLGFNEMHWKQFNYNC